MNRLNQPDFTPPGVEAEGSAQLELDHTEQLFLSHEMRRTARHLQEIPTLAPYRRIVSLGRIPTLGLLGEKSKTSLMNIAYTEAGPDLDSAVIRLRTEGASDVALQLKPTGDTWEVRHPGASEPDEELTTSDLIGFLSPHLSHPEALEPLMDSTSPTPRLAIDALGNFYKRSARSKHISTLYRTRINETSAIATLEDDRVNNRARQILSVTAKTKVGSKVVEKAYIYETHDPGVKKHAGGIVRIRSKDGIARNQLATFAQLDQDNNYPLDVLHGGLASIRDDHDLYDANRRVA